MNKTVVIWMAIAALLAMRSFVRPSYAVGLYMLTFFAAPKFWWWGDVIEDYRWNLFAGVLLLVTIVATQKNDDTTPSERPLASTAVPILVFMAVNVVLVHLLLAVNPASSFGWLIIRLKFLLLFFLLQYSVRDQKDFRIIAMSVALGMGYIGWEATINERGSFSGGRLEGVGAAGVQSSNQLASLLITGLPIAVTLLFTTTSNWMKATVLVACGLAFNVVLMCNSRGAFLGVLIAGFVFLLMTSGPARKRSMGIAAVALVGTFLLLGDPEILTRFGTTFTSGAERDNSATSRIVFWTAASEMLVDFPLGSGGNSFSEGRGWRYMGRADAGDTRAIHNGFITEAVDWGIQGLALMLLFLLAIWRTTRRGRKMALQSGDVNAMMICACLAASLAAWAVSSVFGDYLNDEWGFWTAGLAYAFLRVHTFAPSIQTEPAAMVAVHSRRPLSTLAPRSSAR